MNVGCSLAWDIQRVGTAAIYNDRDNLDTLSTEGTNEGRYHSSIVTQASA